MKIHEVKIKNIEYLDGKINIYENSGYIKYKIDENPILKVIFKETDYIKQQKIIYFK